ncbi:MAG: YiiX/YebB-like N1pC/P60 family cysteine hydrolase, partial [Prevotella sp.]|nr:YiiX/YebB-like N1pC/P60 family cysteine hydrolase [Prevotella sp.]
MKIKIIRRLLLLLPSCLAVAVSAFGQSDTLSSALRDCDLLFQVNPGGNAITDVTSGVDGLAIDHVAIFARLDGRPSVIEALPERGVCITPVDSFLGRRRFADGRPAVVVGRVGERLDCAKTIAAALSYVGCRYDS